MATYSFEDLTPEELIDEMYDEFEIDGNVEKIAALTQSILQSPSDFCFIFLR